MYLTGWPPAASLSANTSNDHSSSVWQRNVQIIGKKINNHHPLSYLENFNDFRGEMHHCGRSDPAVDAIYENTSPDGMRNRSEFGLLISFPSCRGQLSRKRARQPFPDLRRDRIRLYFRQLIIFIRQPSVGQTFHELNYRSREIHQQKIGEK